MKGHFRMSKRGITLPSYLWIAIGAVVGANARYYIGLWAGSHLGATFPYGTLIVNLTGSFALGFLAGTTTGRLNISPEVRLMLGVGFLGAYTTFSSFTVETLTLLQNGNIVTGLVNILANNLAGLTCALLGVYLARAIG
jgi:CrcB protein